MTPAAAERRIAEIQAALAEVALTAQTAAPAWLPWLKHAELDECEELLWHAEQEQREPTHAEVLRIWSIALAAESRMIGGEPPERGAKP